MIRNAFAATLYLLLAAGAVAAEPAFVYRGVLSEAAAPANGRYGLRVSVYDSADATTPFAGPATFEAVDVVDGTFALPLELDAALDPSATAWVEVAVRGPGDSGYVTLDGRQPIKAIAGGTCWELTGNAGTAPAGNFVGTSDSAPLRIRGGGGIGVNTATPEPTTVMTMLGGNGNGGTLWLQSPKGPNVSHVHFGTSGDWFLRSAANNGKVVLQDTSATGQVAIGTSSPQVNVKLHVQDGVATGGATLQFTPNVKIESDSFAALDLLASGVDESILTLRNGAGAIASLSRQGQTNAESLLVILMGTGASSYEYDFSTRGLGINRVPATNALEVNGNASKTTAGSWLANSDARIKTGVDTIRGAMQTLSRLRLVTFRYTPEYLARYPAIADHEYFNVIAQEFAEVFPDWVQDSGEKTDAGEAILQVDTYPITIVTAAAVQELHAEMTLRDERIAALEARLARLEQMLAADGRHGGAP